MAANALGLCFLVLGISGLANAISFRRDNEWDQRIDHPWSRLSNRHWRYSKKLLRFDMDYMNYRHLFRPSNIYDPLNQNLDEKTLFPRPSTKFLKSYQPEVQFDNPWFKGGIKVPGLRLHINDFSVGSASESLTETASSNPVTVEVWNSRYSNVDSNAVKGEKSITYVREIPSHFENPTTRNTESDSSVSSKSLDVSRDDQGISLPESSKPSQDIGITGSESSKISSEGTSALNSETNTPSNGNSEAVNSRNKTTEALENREVDLSENTSISQTEENFGEIETASTDVNSVEINSRVSRDSTSTSIPKVANNSDEDTITSDISVSYETSSDTEEAGENTLISEANSSGKDMQRTTSQIKSTVTLDLTPLTDKVFSSSIELLTAQHTDEIPDAISSTLESTKSKSSKTEAVSQDHVIRIASIRTARLIVSVVFLVIALVAVAILAIYIFRAKRRAAQYDQVLLLP